MKTSLWPAKSRHDNNVVVACVCCIGGLVVLAAVFAGSGRSESRSPRVWSEAALKEWALPVAALGQPPGHFSEEEYYGAPLDNLRTFPVYYPGREPEGYWETLQKMGPQPLIEEHKLKSQRDWVDAGRIVFDSLDVPAFRSRDPKKIEAARTVETFEKAKIEPFPDGTINGLRWVPTGDGIALGINNCSDCHTRRLPNGQILRGAPSNIDAIFLDLPRWLASPMNLDGDSLGLIAWKSWSVPWAKDDIHEPLKTMEPPELGKILAVAFSRPGIFPRWSGSPFYATKVPDLIGLKERKYIDHTATHRHRGPDDVARYAALVTYAEAPEFGPDTILTGKQRRIHSRFPDAAMRALALYIYSLEPPPNPNKFDGKAAAGQKLFEREGCIGCHTPPLYTNNMLTLAEGFEPPAEHSKVLDILPVSVGTDSGLALKTRKGTGYYKVPSLKGVWYRGHYLHDGALTSLEEMFDPSRLGDDFVPSGYKAPGREKGPVRGHEFGLTLKAAEREQLIAFLKTL